MRIFALLMASLSVSCGARSGLDVLTRDSAVAAVETCDGRDEDLDGRTDEGLPSLSCGMGACARERPSCEEGRPVVCPPVVPTEEVCNRSDDDCDGRIDEGLGFGPIGDPIVIREVEAERTGECSACATVLNVQLVTFGRELHAVWHVNFSGLPGVPNTYARRLSDRGVPLEPSRPLLSALTTQLSLAPSHSGLTMASFCQRFEDHRDYPRSQLIDERGETEGEVLLRAFPETPCNTRPLGIWTGDVHLFIRPRRTRTMVVELADVDGRSLRHSENEWWMWQDEERDAAFDGRHVTLAHVRDYLGEEVALLELDTSGETTFSEVLSWPPSPPKWYSPVAELADEDGPLLAVLGHIGEGALSDPTVLGLFRFDREGATLRPTAEIDVDLAGEITLLRRGPDELLVVLTGIRDRHAVARETGNVEVLRLSEGGEVLGRWGLVSSDDPLHSFDAHPHLGSVFVSYVRQLDRESTTVEILELGCVP